MTNVAAPPDPDDEDVTNLLQRMNAGDAQAAASVAPLIYRELRRAARNYISKERIGHTLQPTALVHEAYIKMSGMQRVEWQSRAHFIGFAATLMRNILIDYARRRNARAEGYVQPDGDQILARIGRQQARELVAVNDALDALVKVEPRQARVVELRYFGGLSESEIGELLGVSERTVKRDYALAKVWLQDQMNWRHR
jgi:RNA polymerase sigma factor (TIGR02999 family)